MIDDQNPDGDVELARLVARGRTGAQIAQDLGVAPGVARYRLRKALERAGADTAAEFAALVLGRAVAACDPVESRLVPAVATRNYRVSPRSARP